VSFVIQGIITLALNLGGVGLDTVVPPGGLGGVVSFLFLLCANELVKIKKVTRVNIIIRFMGYSCFCRANVIEIRVS